LSTNCAVTIIIPPIIYALLFLVFWPLLKRFLGSYMDEKGRNLATKEDVQDITAKVEAVRTEFATRLEMQKSELARIADVHRLGFEWEFPVLRQLWTKVNDVLAEAQWVHLSSAQRPGGDADKAKAKLSKFIDALKECDQIIVLNKPFVHEDVYTAAAPLITFLSELYNKAVDEYGDPVNPEEFWKQARGERDKILKGVEDICAAIRRRVAPAFHKG